jgi:hypothetical protein
VAPDAPAGRIEDRDGQTVIYLRSDVLPDPSDPSTYSQAEVAGVQEFKRQFPRIFAEKYRARYEADPATYGRHNWANVSVELERFTGIQVAGAEVDLLAIAGGVAPDVLYINFRKSDNYIRNNFLYPLDRPEDGYLSGMTQEEIDFRINEKLWPVIQRKGPQGEKHVWAIPWGGALGKVLLFRKDLFDQKNIPHPTAKWTWDDMLAAARQLTDPRNGVYGLQLSRGKHESWYWVTYLWSAGGEVMEYDEDSDEWRCVFGSRAAAEALDFYTRLGRGEVDGQRWDAAARLLDQGCGRVAGEVGARRDRHGPVLHRRAGVLHDQPRADRHGAGAAGPGRAAGRRTEQPHDGPVLRHQGTRGAGRCLGVHEVLRERRGGPHQDPRHGGGRLRPLRQPEVPAQVRLSGDRAPVAARLARHVRHRHRDRPPGALRPQQQRGLRPDDGADRAGGTNGHPGPASGGPGGAAGGPAGPAEAGGGSRE